MCRHGVLSGPTLTACCVDCCRVHCGTDCKVTEQDILCRIVAENCSKDRPETLHILPHLLFRNNWSWGYGVPKPKLYKVSVWVLMGGGGEWLMVWMWWC